MAHKTLVNATAYEISGGRTLVNGTGYSIDKGKTLVGGTAYEVGFGHPVLIAGGGIGVGAGYTATIDDVSYPFTSAWSLETVSTASVTVTSLQAMGRISVNGEVVFTGAGDYTVDLSGATHISLYSNMIVMMITTYNIPIIKDVTITVTGAGYSGLAQIEHNGIVYTGATKFTAKTGDLIRVSAKNPTTGNSDYYYLVTSDAVFNMNYQTSGSSGANGSVGITTIPEGHALVQITGSGSATYSYLTINGTKHTAATTLAVPVGTNIYCYVRSTNQGYADIVLPDGSRIYAETEKSSSYYAEYNYNVSGDVQIKLNYDSIVKAGFITITEQ